MNTFSMAIVGTSARRMRRRSPPSATASLAASVDQLLLETLNALFGFELDALQWAQHYGMSTDPVRQAQWADAATARLLEREVHGTVQLSQIELERLLGPAED